jgi:hypothetical protein
MDKNSGFFRFRFNHVYFYRVTDRLEEKIGIFDFPSQLQTDEAFFFN